MCVLEGGGVGILMGEVIVVMKLLSSCTLPPVLSFHKFVGCVFVGKSVQYSTAVLNETDLSILSGGLNDCCGKPQFCKFVTPGP